MKHTLLKNLRGIIYTLLLFISIACSKPDKLQQHLTVRSENGLGIIVSKIIPHRTPELPIKLGASNFCNYKVHPTIPSESHTLVSLSDFRGLPAQELPNYITFEYQFYEISNCTSSRKDNVLSLQFLVDYLPYKKGDTITLSLEKANFYLNKTHGIVIPLMDATKDPHSTSSEYYTKTNCKIWQPISTKNIRKTISLAMYKKANAIQRFRKKQGNIGSYYGTNITYEFYDNGDIKLNLENYTTNLWK